MKSKTKLKYSLLKRISRFFPVLILVMLFGAPPTIQVIIDRQKAALFGLPTDMIGCALKTAYNGLDVSTYRESNKDYDITVQLSEKDRRLANVLREWIIPLPTGYKVPLSTLADIKYTGTIGDIVRVDNRRVVTVKPMWMRLRFLAPWPVPRQKNCLLNFLSHPVTTYNLPASWKCRRNRKVFS